MISSALALEVRRTRALGLWMLVVVVVYGGFMAAMFPILRDNAKLVDDYLKIMPKEFMAAFGMTGSLSDHGIFFTTYVSSWLWPIVAAIVGIVLATRPVAADLDRGFLELPLATPVTRIRYLATPIAVQAALLALLAVGTVGGVLAVGLVVGAGFDAARFALVIPLLFAFGCAIAGPVTLLSVVTLSRGQAAGIATGVLFAMYLLEVVGKIQPDLEVVAALSAFHYFPTTAIIDRGAVPTGEVALFGAVALAGWGLALWAFRRRDLVA